MGSCKCTEMRNLLHTGSDIFCAECLEIYNPDKASREIIKILEAGIEKRNVAIADLQKELELVGDVKVS